MGGDNNYDIVEQSLSQGNVLLDSSISLSEIEEIQIHNNIKTNIDFIPEFKRVTGVVSNHHIDFLSCDIVNILCTRIQLKEKCLENTIFNISTIALKNLKLFSQNLTLKLVHTEQDYLIADSCIEKDGVTLRMKYAKPCKVLQTSFYENNTIQGILTSLDTLLFSPVLSSLYKC